MDIEYWEIWNEPDLDPDDSNHKRCWGGTAKEFYELFRVTLEHLKACFPHLKIGGPACAGLREEWVDGLFSSLGEVKPDFFSWHVYGSTVEKVREKIQTARRFMEKHGLGDKESILNEWNYVKGWEGEDWIYSLKSEKSLKGAAFTAAVMEMSQYESLDLLMYYDARPCGMNGLYCTDYVFETLKGYYPFPMFNRLYTQGEAVAVERRSEDVWAAAARGEEQVVMLHFELVQALTHAPQPAAGGGVQHRRGRVFIRQEFPESDESFFFKAVRAACQVPGQFLPCLEVVRLFPQRVLEQLQRFAAASPSAELLELLQDGVCTAAAHELSAGLNVEMPEQLPMLTLADALEHECRSFASAVFEIALCLLIGGQQRATEHPADFLAYVFAHIGLVQLVADVLSLALVAEMSRSGFCRAEQEVLVGG
jgi:hypothetical protein